MPIRLPKTTRLRLPHLRLPDLRLLVLGALVVAMPARADQGPLKLAALTNRPSQAPVTPRALAPRLDGSLPPGRLPAPDEVLSYRPDPAVRRRNFEVFVDRLRAHDAGAAENLDRLLTDNDVIAAARDWLKPYGMRPENVADAMAVYLSTAWAAVRGSDADPAPEVMRGLSDQLAAAIGATPGFTRASDAEKQELAEIDDRPGGHHLPPCQRRPRPPRAAEAGRRGGGAGRAGDLRAGSDPAGSYGGGVEVRAAGRRAGRTMRRRSRSVTSLSGS